MASAERNRKLFVRSVLVTGSTIATLVGAQSLIMLDMNQGNVALAAEPVILFPDSQQESFLDDDDLVVLSDVPVVSEVDQNSATVASTTSSSGTSSRPLVQRSRSSR